MPGIRCSWIIFPHGPVVMLEPPGAGHGPIADHTGGAGVPGAGAIIYIGWGWAGFIFMFFLWNSNSFSSFYIRSYKKGSTLGLDISVLVFALLDGEGSLEDDLFLFPSSVSFLFPPLARDPCSFWGC